MLASSGVFYFSCSLFYVFFQCQQSWPFGYVENILLFRAIIFVVKEDLHDYHDGTNIRLFTRAQCEHISKRFMAIFQSLVLLNTGQVLLTTAINLNTWSYQILYFGGFYILLENEDHSAIFYSDI